MKIGNAGKIIIIIAIVLCLVTILITGAYNSLVIGREEIISKEANIDTMLQRRADLIPNLVSTVKNFTEHENEVIEKVVEARAALTSANSLQDKADADSNLSKAVDNLMIVVENYPELKSDTSYTELMNELAGSENRIAVARRDYNEVVKSYNNNINKFPKKIIANFFGFKKAQYFNGDENSKETPDVKDLFD